MTSDNEMIMKIDKGFSDYIGEARYISGKDNLTHLYLCFKMASIPLIKKNSELQDRLSEAERVIDYPYSHCLSCNGNGADVEFNKCQLCSGTGNGSLKRQYLEKYLK